MKSLYLIFVCSLLILSSCENSPGQDATEEMAAKETLRDPMEANQLWVEAWNQNNPQQLDSLTASKAFLYMEGNSMPAESIRAWYKEAAPMMEDLKINSLMSYAGENVAYDSGTYIHGVKGDTTETSYEGTYTFIWKREGDNWKMEVININDRTQDTISSEM